jgi:hypothetical protein
MRERSWSCWILRDSFGQNGDELIKDNNEPERSSQVVMLSDSSAIYRGKLNGPEGGLLLG